MRFQFLSSLCVFFLLLALSACGGGGGSGDDSTGSEPQTSLSALSSLRIMPLGDSITEAEGGHASYRYWLWQFLLAEGLEVDFVGGRSGVFRGQPLFSDFDQDHQGHWDWHADQLLANSNTYASLHNPDIVLLHAGTNDLRRNESIDSTLNETAQIIDTFRVHNPNVNFIVARIIPSSVGNDRIDNFNNSLPALVAAMDQEDSRVILVDQNTDFFLSSDTYDGVHPSQSGEQKMALRWLSALRTLL